MAFCQRRRISSAHSIHGLPQSGLSLHEQGKVIQPPLVLFTEGRKLRIVADVAAGVGQPEQAAPFLVELAVVDIVRLAAELCLFALFCREHTLFDQLIQTDEIGVASKGGKALIRLSP